MLASRSKVPLRRRGLVVLIALLAAAAAVAGAAAPPAHAEPPEPPGKEVTLDHLAELRVAPEGSSDGYSRQRFPHWSTVEGPCDTREIVLRRDGTRVRTNASCRAVSGTW
jgi:hypothetical protein